MISKAHDGTGWYYLTDTEIGGVCGKANDPETAQRLIDEAAGLGKIAATTNRTIARILYSAHYDEMVLLSVWLLVDGGFGWSVETNCEQYSDGTAPYLHQAMAQAKGCI